MLADYITTAPDLFKLTVILINSHQLRARTEAIEVKETAARNEYLLSLAAANAHQIRYYSTDLPEIMKVSICHCWCLLPVIG